VRVERMWGELSGDGKKRGEMCVWKVGYQRAISTEHGIGFHPILEERTGVDMAHT
jgi:hypothetical protein